MNTTLYVKRFDPTVVVEVSEDVSLPDYLPEVRRVVGVQTSSTVDGKYLSGDELEADGGVTYTVLYVTDNGSLAQISQTTSYTGHIPLKVEEGRFSAEDIVLSVALDNVNCRVSAPRKIVLSSKVRLNALSQKPVDVSLKLENPLGVAENRVRRRSAEIPTACMTEVRHNGKVEGDIREREGMELVFASGSLCLSDVRMVASTGQVQIKGDAYLTALLRSPEGAYVLSRSRVPVEEEISVQNKSGAEEVLIPVAFGKVVMIEIEGGEEGMFSWKLEYDIDCDLMRSGTADVTMDAYLPETQDILEMSDFRVCAPAASVNGRLTTSAAMNLRADTSFVCAWGSGSAEQAEIANGKMNISGSVKLSVVTVGGGEYFLDDVSIPVKYVCDCLNDVEGAHLDGRMQIDVTEITARADGNTLNLTAELGITAALLSGKDRTAAVRLTPVDEQNPAECRKNRIRVYVPDVGETAWDVEKRFRLGREAVMEGDAYVV